MLVLASPKGSRKGVRQALDPSTQSALARLPVCHPQPGGMSA